jgi:hypothetical protein
VISKPINKSLQIGLGYDRLGFFSRHKTINAEFKKVNVPVLNGWNALVLTAVLNKSFLKYFCVLHF